MFPAERVSRNRIVRRRVAPGLNGEHDFPGLVVAAD